MIILRTASWYILVLHFYASFPAVLWALSDLTLLTMTSGLPPVETVALHPSQPFLQHMPGEDKTRA